MHMVTHKIAQPPQPACGSLTSPSAPATLAHLHEDARADDRAGSDGPGVTDRPENREDVRGTAPQRSFSTIRVYAPEAIPLQPKLTINTPGDVYEQEAERTAAQVIDMPSSQAHGGCTCGGDCPNCQAKHHSQDHEPLRIQRVSTQDTSQIAAPPIVNQVLRSAGRPLDATTAGFFAPRFGHDFSQVRIHTDQQAAASAQSIQARAYTAGRAIVFGPGQYQPNTREGQRLLAHELTHVVQQGASGSQTVHAARIQRDEVRFTDCTQNGHDLDSFRVIPNDQDEPMYAPQDGVEHEDVDGFLWRPVREHWYKIPFGCDAEVVCGVNEEGNREIDPEGDCNFVGDARGGTRWEPFNISPLNARPFPWPD